MIKHQERDENNSLYNNSLFVKTSLKLHLSKEYLLVKNSFINICRHPPMAFNISEAPLKQIDLFAGKKKFCKQIGVFSQFY